MVVPAGARVRFLAVRCTEWLVVCVGRVGRKGRPGADKAGRAGKKQI